MTSFVQVPPDSTGKQVDAQVVGSNYRQITCIGDLTTAANLASVLATASADNQNISALFALLVGAAPLLYNGANLDRQYGNFDQTAIGSTVYNSATTTNSADLINFNARGIVIGFDITAYTTAGTSTTINVQAKFGAHYATLYTFVPTVAAVATQTMCIYPGAASAGAWTIAPIQGIIPRTFRIQVVTVGTPNYTATYYVDSIL